jgi:hypothetical protein
MRDAFAELRRRDLALLERSVSERAIVSRLATYVARRFARHDVDVEYDRHGLDPKFLDLPLGCEPTRGLVVPDLIVHRRGHDRANLVVVEVKKERSRSRPDRDRAKVIGLIEQYGYRWGALLRVPTGVDAGRRSEEWEWM